MSDNMISEDLAQTALYIWGNIVERLASKEPDNIKELVESLGVTPVRDMVLTHYAPALEEAYEAVKDSYDLPFDLEFVPDFMNKIEEKGLIASRIEVSQAKAIGLEILEDVRALDLNNNKKMTPGRSFKFQ